MSARPKLLASALALSILALPATASESRPGTARVFIVDNAFVRDVQRPVVRIGSGSSVAWQWRSRQSHSVLVRSGPERFTARTRTRGTFTRRFTRPGTYRIVCALHAPGMRMSVVVSRG